MPETVETVDIPCPPLAERLKDDKMDKKLKKCIKMGGKRGVEIEGAADMGGLQYFCTLMDEPEGDLDLLVECVKAMNAKSDPAEEERKGGSGHLGKTVVSFSEDQFSMVCYVPPAKQEECKAKQWMEAIIPVIGGGAVSEASDDVYAMLTVKKDLDKNIVPLKMRDVAISAAYNFLRSKDLFPKEDDDDDDDEMVFGDEDFPS